MAAASADPNDRAALRNSNRWWFEMPEENRDRGYRRIQGALSNPGHELARGKFAGILERHGFEPAPERIRKTTRKEFLTRHLCSSLASYSPRCQLAGFSDHTGYGAPELMS
jgi:hypothetical protein